MISKRGLVHKILKVSLKCISTFLFILKPTQSVQLSNVAVQPTAQVVTAQPGLTTNVIVNMTPQPGFINVNPGIKPWSSGICSCFDDIASCKFLLDPDPFCRVTGTLCFRLQMTAHGFQSQREFIIARALLWLVYNDPQSHLWLPGIRPGWLSCGASMIP